MLRIKELAIVVATGRPRRRVNHAQKDPRVVATKDIATTKKATTKKATTKKATTKKATKSRSTKRDLSRFEVI